MISKIILHIGVHKTATTTIQNTLTNEREKLAALGVLYPLFYANEFIFNNHSIPLFSLFSKYPERYHINKTHGFTTKEAIQQLHQGYSDQLRAQVSSFSGDTLVLSGEDLSNFKSQNLDQLKAFLQEVTHPDIKIQVVVVCRHPVTRFRSSVQFTVSNFGMRMKKAIEFHSVRKNQYQTLINNFVTVFGRENISVLKYEDMLGHPFGPAGAFLEMINPSIPAKIKPQIIFENAGFSYEAVILSNAINHAWPVSRDYSLHAERLFPVATFLSELPGSKFVLSPRLSEKAWKELSQDVHWLTTEFSLPPYVKPESTILSNDDHWDQQTMQYLAENLDQIPQFYRKAIGKGIFKTAVFGSMITLKRRLELIAFLISNRRILFGKENIT